MSKKKEEKSSKNLVQDYELVTFKVKVNTSNLLFDGKSPGYPKRFASWARSTQGEHLTNLIEAVLSEVANISITGKGTTLFPSSDPLYLRGIAAGVLSVSEIIRQNAGETIQVDSNNEQDEFGFIN
jgi:hypothetical protein